jgi:hypothetical protein
LGIGRGLAATTVSKISPSGDAVAVEYTGEDGKTYQETIPIYQAGSIRYFVTGIGLEERSAQYPPFPLKIVFVVGPRAYLSQVSVTIRDKEGKVLLQVPSEKVTGPWLFVDLPPGRYDISATGNQTEVKTKTTITTGHTQAVYLRWKEGG